MKARIRLSICFAVALIFLAVGIVYRNEISWFCRRLPIISRFFRPTVEGQIAAYGPSARERLNPIFAAHQIQYPPRKVAFLAIKATKQLEVYCKGNGDTYQFVCTYPILGASGKLGPKLREGDRQVPEGIYKLSLEPNTPYHLALRLNYPNDADLSRARADRRENPGSDILIHGTTGSIGCIAVGDQASEDLFVLVHDAHDQKTDLIIAPVDLRDSPPPPQQQTDPSWLPTLYGEIRAAMSAFPRPTP